MGHVPSKLEFEIVGKIALNSKKTQQLGRSSAGIWTSSHIFNRMYILNPCIHKAFLKSFQNSIIQLLEATAFATPVNLAE